MTNSPAPQFDLITIGDSTVDTFIKVHEASLECDINKKDCKICVPYGSKVPVEAIEYAVAGNAANVAVAGMIYKAALKKKAGHWIQIV